MTPRLVRMRLMFAVALGLLGIRLVHLQLIRGAYYRNLAEQNRLRVIPEQAPRGVIVDRRDRILAANQTVFRVAIVPQDVENLPAVLTRVSQFVHKPVEALAQKYAKERSLSFVPATIVSHVPKEIALRLEEERWRLPGLLIQAETIRSYPRGSSAAHILGYLSQPTSEELAVLKQYGVRPKHLVGRMGLEALLDDALRGRGGGLMVEVNNRGQQVRVLGRRPPEPGQRVTLTVDANLQSLIEQALGAQAGACVVLDPQTGAVLAMVSAPSFSPAAFVTPEGNTVSRLLNDPAAPLMNRAAVGVYTPGSIAKLVVAAAALENHVVTPQTQIVCPGSLTIGDRIFHCWNRDGHGPLTMPEAIMHSCNVYFMTMGRRLGQQRLRAAMERIGFSHRTGWPLEEQPGRLPQRRLSEGEVAILGIGQGEILLTVLQAAVMASVFANKGWVVEPWVVHSIGDHEVAHRAPHQIGWSASTIDTVLTGMRMVIREPAGTGHRAFTPVISIAGKTGTAQTHVVDRPNGWFVGFCPVDAPRIAIAIVTELGGSGGDLPAEIARTICEYVAAPDTL